MLAPLMYYYIYQFSPNSFYLSIVYDAWCLKNTDVSVAQVPNLRYFYIYITWECSMFYLFFQGLYIYICRLFPREQLSWKSKENIMCCLLTSIFSSQSHCLKSWRPMIEYQYTLGQKYHASQVFSHYFDQEIHKMPQ